MEWDIGFGGSFGPEDDDYRAYQREKKEKRDAIVERLSEKYIKPKLETMMYSESDELPRIKDRLEQLEYENQKMRDQNKLIQRKLKYWREQSKELAELRLMKYQISKDKDRVLIKALKRGTS